jgi:hypothetical protein
MTTLQLKNAKPGMHADGNGLYLYVKEGGAKSWIFRYQISGRRREMGLGAVANLTVIPARAEAARLKAIVANKLDPLDEKDRVTAAAHAAKASEDREVALEAKTFSCPASAPMRQIEGIR